jgi:hypothetical protein
MLSDLVEQIDEELEIRDALPKDASVVTRHKCVGVSEIELYLSQGWKFVGECLFVLSYLPSPHIAEFRIHIEIATY